MPAVARIDWEAARLAYLEQAPPRSFTAVARSFGVTQPAVARRARLDGWVAQAAEFDRTASRKAMRHVLRSATDRYADVVRLGDALVTKTLEQIDDGTMELKAGDAAPYIKLMLLLDGEATERVDIIQVRSAVMLLVHGTLPILENETLSVEQRRTAFFALADQVGKQLGRGSGDDE